MGNVIVLIWWQLNETIFITGKFQIVVNFAVDLFGGINRYVSLVVIEQFESLLLRNALKVSRFPNGTIDRDMKDISSTQFFQQHGLQQFVNSK